MELKEKIRKKKLISTILLIHDLYITQNIWQALMTYLKGILMTHSFQQKKYNDRDRKIIILIKKKKVALIPLGSQNHQDTLK